MDEEYIENLNKLVEYLLDCGFLVYSDLFLHLNKEHHPIWEKINEIDNRLNKIEKKLNSIRRKKK